MKFAIAIENTKKSWELFESFFEKMNFCPNYTIDVITVQEIEGQESEIHDLKKRALRMLARKNVKGEFIVEKGDPVSRVAKLVLDRKIDVLVCSYKHSIFGTTFFEEIMGLIDIPIMVLR